MSAEAALAQRLRAGAVSGNLSRNGTGGTDGSEGYRSTENRLASEGKQPIGTGGTDGTGISEEVQRKRTENGTGQAANDPATGATDAPATDWRATDRLYLNHHFGCPTCCAAGRGYGQRCATGARLKNEYEAAWIAAQTNGRKRT